MTPAAAWYVGRRLAQVLPALLLVVTASFVLVHLAPGSPINILAGQQSSHEYQVELSHRLGLDRPLLEQYLRYIALLASGDLGRSIIQGRPVWQMIFERVPATLLLVVPALLLSVLLGVLTGLAAVSRRGSPIDRMLIGASLLGQAVPVFVSALVLILLLSVWVGVLPVQGMRDVRETYTGIPAVLDLLRHMVLPVTALAIGHVAVMARLTRSGVADQLEQAHVVTARSKGLRRRTVLLRHALRNALAPIVTALGNEAAILLGGAVITERIFGWPGLGQLTLDAALSRDYPVLLGIVLVVAIAIVLINLVVDLLYPVIDPRVRLR